MYLALLAISVLGLVWTVRSLVRAPKPTVLPRPVFGSLTNPMSRMLATSKRGRRDLAKDLRRAGAVHSIAIDNYLATRNAVLVAWLFFTVGLLAFGLVEFGSWWLWPSIVGCIVIVGLPRVYVSIRSSERAKTIGQELPDTLDFLAMMMSGGMTMQQSLNQVVSEFDDTHPELSSELKLLARQSETGTLDQALQSFAERLDLPEITALSAMLRGGNRVGNSLVDSLRNFADGLRTTRDETARERGNKAAIKLLMPVVFCLAPPIYIMLLGPAFLELKGFVEKENRPGGALAPTVQNRQADGRPRVLQAENGTASIRR